MIASRYENPRRRKTGYTLLKKRGEYNLHRFSAALDWSLDRLKLQEVYEHIYGDTDFSFTAKRKQYTTRVINVTFKYAAREWNRVGGTTYVKLGVCERDVKIEDCACMRGGELIGITLDQPVFGKPLQKELLEPYFEYRDGQYKMLKQPKVAVNVADARRELYEKGFYCDGAHYVRWKRSAGSARVGKCLFIDERLYADMHQWEMCGLEVDEGDAVDLAALECYIALTLSSMIDTLEIQPENILVIDDYESVFEDDVISVEENNGKLTAARKACEIRNSIWDGQGLISPDLMGRYSDKGMVLLRNRFFKCCAFNCNIQKWFADHGVTEVSQLAGRTRAKRIADIKLITTPSSIKYLKFGSLDGWLDHLEPEFGLVKHEKKTHFFDGRMVQVHYQLLNTLQMSREEVREFLQPTFEYMTALRDDPAVLRYHIKYPIDPEQDYISPALSKNDIVFRMMGITDAFAQTKIYHDFKNDLLKSLTKELRIGHVMVNGNYSTMCGNPIEMLRAAIGKFDGTSQIGAGNIHSTRFEYGKRLLGSRSPHITCSNVWLPMNQANELIDCYLNPTEEIVYINSIGENVLNRLSGCDFDSDSTLLTDNRTLVHAAQKNVGSFPIAVSNIAARKAARTYSKVQQYDLDKKTCQNQIGVIINLSQELNTLMWDRLNHGEDRHDVEDIYCDICILNALSGVAIDAAKKEFNVNTTNETGLLKAKYMRLSNGRQVKPNFFAAKDKGKGYYDPIHKDYLKHDTTMDYIQSEINRYRMRRDTRKKAFLPFSDLIAQDDFNIRNVWKPKAERVLRLIREMRRDIRAVWSNESYDDEKKAYIAGLRRQDGIEYIGSINMTRNTMVYLLRCIESERNRDIRQTIFNTLFGYPNMSFFGLIRQSAAPVPVMVQDPEGDIQFFDMHFKKGE